MILINMSVFEPHLKTGRLKVLGTATEKRLQLHPELPTISETLPGYFINAWFALAAPAKTPVEILDKIHVDVVKVLGETEFIEKFLRPQSVEPDGRSRDATVKFIRAEFDIWGKMVQASGAKVE